MKIKFTYVETPVVIDRDKVNLGDDARNFEKFLEVKQTIYDGTYNEVLEITKYEDSAKCIELKDSAIKTMRNLALGAFDLPKVADSNRYYFGFRSYKECFGTLNHNIIEDIECFEYLRRFQDNIVDIIVGVTKVPSDFYVSYNGALLSGYDIPEGVSSIGFIVAVSIRHFVDRAEAIVGIYRDTELTGETRAIYGISNIIAALAK